MILTKIATIKLMTRNNRKNYTYLVEYSDFRFRCINMISIKLNFIEPKLPKVRMVPNELRIMQGFDL